MANKYDATKHILVPLHQKLSDSEKKRLLEKYSITLKELPKIAVADPAIQHLNPEIGDVVKITRKSATAGKTSFFRRVGK